jgi:hypothetical protein
MASIRKILKICWMSVKPMIKEIKSYGHKFSYIFRGTVYLLEGDL